MTHWVPNKTRATNCKANKDYLTEAEEGERQLHGVIKLPNSWGVTQLGRHPQMQRWEHRKKYRVETTRCRGHDSWTTGLKYPPYCSGNARLGTEQKEIVLDKKLNMSWQCELTAWRCIQRFCPSPLSLRAHWSSVHSSVSQTLQGHGTVRAWPEDATKLIKGLELLPYKDRLRKLEKLVRRIQSTFQHLKELQESWRGPSHQNCSDSTRGNGYNWKRGNLCEILGRNPLLRGWWNSRTDCPGSRGCQVG